MKTNHNVRTLDYEKFNYGNSMLHILDSAGKCEFVFQAGKKRWALRKDNYLRTEIIGTTEEMEDLIISRVQNGFTVSWYSPKIMSEMPRFAAYVVAQEVARELEL